MNPLYLAGPFFNDEQRMVLQEIEGHCRVMGVPFFSPRLECLCPPDAPESVREAAFYANVDHIRNASLVLARIDNFDPGTMWELGYAYAEQKRTYAFTTVEGRGLNLMIAQSGAKFLQGMPEVLEFLNNIKIGNDSPAKLWKKEIV